MSIGVYCVLTSNISGLWKEQAPFGLKPDYISE